MSGVASSHLMRTINSELVTERHEVMAWTDLLLLWYNCYMEYTTTVNCITHKSQML